MPIEPQQSTTAESSASTPAPTADHDPTADVKKMASTAKDETAAVAMTAVQGGREVIDEVSDQASVVAANAKDQIATLVTRAKDEMRVQGEVRGQQVVSGLQTLSDQLSAVVQGHPDQAGGVGTVLTDAQQRVQSYVQSVQDRGPTALVDDATAFARRRPGVFLATASLIGFAMGRLVRSGTAAANDRTSPATGTSAKPAPHEDRSGSPSSSTFAPSGDDVGNLGTQELADDRVSTR